MGHLRKKFTVKTSKPNLIKPNRSNYQSRDSMNDDYILNTNVKSDPQDRDGYDQEYASGVKNENLFEGGGKRNGDGVGKSGEFVDLEYIEYLEMKNIELQNMIKQNNGYIKTLAEGSNFDVEEIGELGDA